MRKFLMLLVFSSITLIAFSQVDSLKTDTLKGWRKGGIVSLNIGQGGSRNWAAGAEKWSVSIGGIMNLFANKQMGKWSWDNSLDMSYAFINTESQGYRKTDDKIYFVTKFGRAIKPKMNLTILANFRSQFYDGYDYNYLGAGLKRRTSNFMAQAYVSLAPGIDWKPTKSLSVFVTPISARWIIVSNKPFDYLFQGGVIPDSIKTPATGDFEKPKSVLYGVDPGREVRFEAGGMVSAQFNKEILKNVVYTSKLDLFSNYLKGYAFDPPTYTTFTRTDAKPQNVDVFWTNVFGMKVNKWLLVTYSFDLIYDDDVRQFGPNGDVAAAQLRSMLSIGIAHKF
ncbi:MAG TPA: DUF3078 domain-containing protein [Chitinophagaceae bacterium]|nr:DUF3078 domain-containing protein [Chitinophagaceae bacterium]